MLTIRFKLKSCLQGYREAVSNNQDGFEYLVDNVSSLFLGSESAVHTESGSNLIIHFFKDILKGNMEYDEYIQHLKDSLPVHQRCHSVFSEKTCIYRCYDCATGVSSCLCSECFEAGDHEGHNYTRYDSNCGGCCDCGDLESWRFEGWCKKHQHAKYVPDADTLMEPTLRNNANNVFMYIFLVLTSLFDCFDNPHKIHLFNALVDFVKTWGDINQSTLRLVTRCFQTPYDRNKLVSLLNRFNYTLPKPILSDKEYQTVDLCTVMLRSLVIHSQPEPFVFLILTMVLDETFREWFIRLYLKELCNVFVDTYDGFLFCEEGDMQLRIQQFREESNTNSREDALKAFALQILRRMMNQEDNENFQLPDDPNYLLIYHQILSELREKMDLSLSTVSMRPCIGYDQFLQSIHCQFFHSESSVYSHDQFPQFCKRLMKTARDIMVQANELFGRNHLLYDADPQFLKFITNLVSAIYTITDDAGPAMEVFFDKVNTRAGEILVPCKEMVEMMHAYQCVFWIDWKTEQEEKGHVNELLSNLCTIYAITSDIFDYLKGVLDGYTREQRVSFIVATLNRFRSVGQSMDDSTYSDEKPCIIHEGRFIYHWVDYYLLHILSFAVTYDIVDSVKSAVHDLEEQLMPCIINGLHILVCNFYFHSLGSVRFTPAQSTVQFYNRVFSKYPSTLESAVFALQAGFIFLSPTKMMAQIFSAFSQGVAVKIDDYSEEQAVGIHLMLSYFVFNLLTIVYNRLFIHREKLHQNEIQYALLHEENDKKTFNVILQSVSCYMENTDMLLQEVKRITTSQFDSESMEQIYLLKEEYMKNLSVFRSGSNLSTITLYMQYLKEHLKLTNYAVPAFIQDDPLELMARSVLGNSFTIMMLYYMLQRQYIHKMNDIKLVECLLYLVQAIAQWRGHIKPHQEYDLSVFRSFLSSGQWEGKDEMYSDLDCCSLLWTPLQMTSILESNIVEFKLPTTVVGMLSFFYHYPDFPTDLKSLLEDTLKMCVRSECEEDTHFMNLLFKERESQKRDSPSPLEKPKEENLSIQALNSKLDDFLALYEGMEEIEEEEKTEDAVVPIGNPFTCAFCHGEECDPDSNPALLLCHFDHSQTHNLDLYNGLFKHHSLPSNLSIQEQYQQFQEIMKERLKTFEFIDALHPVVEAWYAVYPLASCMHMAHASCFVDFMKNLDTSTFGDDSAHFCPICRRIQSGWYPIILPPTINRDWHNQYFPNPLFNPDRLGNQQWSLMNRLNAEMIVRYFNANWKVQKSDLPKPQEIKQIPDNHFGDSLTPTIIQIDVASRPLSTDNDISFYTYVQKFENNRAILEPNAIRALQQIFLSAASYCMDSERKRGANVNAIWFRPIFIPNELLIKDTPRLMESGLISKPTLQKREVKEKIWSIAEALRSVFGYIYSRLWIVSNDDNPLVGYVSPNGPQYRLFHSKNNVSNSNGDSGNTHAGENDIVNESENDIVNEGENDIVNEGENDIVNEGENDIFNESENDIVNEGENDIVNESENGDHESDSNIIPASPPSSRSSPVGSPTPHDDYERIQSEETSDNEIIPNFGIAAIFDLFRDYDFGVFNSDSEFEEFFGKYSELCDVSFFLLAGDILSDEGDPQIIEDLMDEINRKSEDETFGILFNKDQAQQIREAIEQIKEYRISGKMNEGTNQFHLHLTEKVIQLCNSFTEYITPALLDLFPDHLNPSNHIIVNNDAFSLLSKQLLNSNPIDLGTSNITLLDRYLVTAISLIPQYYILAIQEACFSIAGCCRKHSIALTSVSDGLSMLSSSTLKAMFDCFMSCPLDALTVHLAYEEEIVESLHQKGIEKTIEMLVTTYLRRCAILLFSLNDYSESSQYILPTEFNELIDYLNLPAISKIDEILNEYPTIRIVHQMNLDSVTHFTQLMQESHNHGETVRATCVISQSIINASFLMEMPADARVLNYASHRFHEKKEGDCNQCITCSACGEKAVSPYMCMCCGRHYCSTNNNGLSKCRNVNDRSTLCQCKALINMESSYVYNPYNLHLVYPFGSVYYTKHGSISHRGLVRESLSLNKKAMDILDLVIRNNAISYKSSMIDKILKLKVENM